MRFRLSAIRVLAFAIATTLSWSLWAACADAANIGPHAQMACCKDGELACASNGNANQCCQTGGAQRHDAVPGKTIEAVHAPVAVVVAWAVVPDAVGLDWARMRAHAATSSPPIDPGPPPYIAFSSLLI
jgi:hypothetical protein